MLPETGSISMSQVNIELKKNETAVITLNDTDVRKLAGKPSGVISMNDLRGKSNTEYVENYLLHSGSYSSDIMSSKTYNFKINIPHKITKGTITLNISKGYTYDGGRNSTMNISGIGSVSTFGTTGVSNIDVQGLNSGDYSTTVVANNRLEHSTNQDYQRKDTTNVTVKFTGEWEA